MPITNYSPFTSSYHDQLTDISDCRNLTEVSEKVRGLLDPAEKVNLYHLTETYDHPYEENTLFGQFKGLRNSVTGQPYGICKPSYEIIQNTEAFHSLEQIVLSGGGNFDKCGMWHHGGSAYITVHVDEQTIEHTNDQIGNKLFGINDMGGRMAVAYGNHAIRLWCLNQLPSINTWLKNKVTFRHTKSARDKVIAINEMLRDSKVNFQGTMNTYNDLYNEAMNSDEFKTFSAQLLEEIWPGGVEEPETWVGEYDPQKIKTRRLSQIHDLNIHFLSEEGNTRWAALQAVTAWRDHDNTKSYFSNFQGINARYKARALEMLSGPSRFNN